MAAAPMKLFCVLLFFGSLLYKGKCQCSLSDVVISQAATGARVKGKTEWRVTVSTKCVCSQYSVLVNCDGFQTEEDVEPAILNRSGYVCLVNSGVPFDRANPITFTYAWDPAYPFQALTSYTFCP